MFHIGKEFIQFGVVCIVGFFGNMGIRIQLIIGILFVNVWNIALLLLLLLIVGLLSLVDEIIFGIVPRI